MLKNNTLKINITEGKPNRFEQADNITGVTRRPGALHELSGDVELSDVIYAEIEAEVAAVGDWVAKDWLRAYGVGEEAEKLRHLDAQVVRETHMPRIGSFWRLRGCPYGFRWVVVKSENTTVSVSISHTERWGHSYHTNEFIEQFEPFPQAKTFVDASLLDKHTGDFWFWNVQMAAERDRLDKIKADTQQKLNTMPCAPAIGSVWRSKRSGIPYVVFSTCGGKVRLAYEGTPDLPTLSYSLEWLEKLYVLEGAQKSSNSVDPLPYVPKMLPDSKALKAALRSSGTPVLKHPLQEVFNAVIAQVTTGKGQRHGGGEQPFFEQPWFTTTQQVGIGFPLGQAMKKLGESSSKPDAESFETELLGAIAYAAMAYLANKKLAGKS